MFPYTSPFHFFALLRAPKYNILLCPSRLIENNGIWERTKAKECGDNDGNDLEIVIIDLGQAVERQHPAAKELLVRDLAMVRAFFIRQGVHVLSESDALDFIIAPCEYGKSHEDETDEDMDLEDGGDKDATDGHYEDDAIANNRRNDGGADDGEKGDNQSDDEKPWRFNIPNWDDASDLERLQEKLKATKNAS